MRKTAPALLTAIVLLGGVLLAYAINDRDQQLDLARETSGQIAEQTALIADGTLNATRQMLKSMMILAKFTDRKNPLDADQLRAELIQMKAQNPYIMDLLLINPAGEISHWTGRGNPPGVSDREYFTSHASNTTSGLYFGPPLVSKVHAGQWFFAMSEALRDAQGRLLHVAVAIVDVALLRDRLGVRLAFSDSSQTLMTMDGIVYARTPDHFQHVGKSVNRFSEFSRLTPTEPAATFSMVSALDGKHRLITVRRLASYPMLAAGTISTEETLNAWRQKVIALAMAWVLVSAVSLWLAYRSGKREAASAA